jgi:hypothetical protein
MWLPPVSLFGLVVPNGLFVYWLLFEFNRLAPVPQDKLALGLILDAPLALILLRDFFATRPIGRVGWQWFVFPSLLGGLGFGLPLCYWLNRNRPG